MGIWENVLQDLVKVRRLQLGRNEHPSILIMDAQSVKKTGKGEERGFDGGKK
jgi:putative transposase